MTLPRATYRLQFREGMDFDRAAGLAPYLARLGVSHLYASPLFQAMPGSTHGYDVTDHGVLDAGLGGIEGFLRLSAALKAGGLGLILDIVPNHMAASPHNPWWRDVLRHGRESRYAGHFDIDWSAPNVLVTILGQPYGEALEAGAFTLGREGDGPVWRYYEHAIPLDPRTWPMLDLPPEAADDWAGWIAHGDNGRQTDLRLAEASGDLALMDRLHEAQPWRVAYWRAARDMVTHRRFFEITDLVGVRVEEEAVFDDVHRLLFDLVREGHVDGLRVDHVDGLADPAGYLATLREKAPGHPPVWVEKILAADETLPRDWPVEGTTGYEFARATAALLTDGEGVRAIGEAYDAFTGEEHDYPAMLHAAKREILTRNLAAELDLLTGLAQAALADDPSGRDWGPDSLRRALIAVAIAMPVYRTYREIDASGPRADRAVLDRVEAEAEESVALDDPAPVGLLVALLRGDLGVEAADFRRRFQQTTGALMAKAVEDTLFYRYNRLISTNEVGAEPEHAALDANAFHGEMRTRLATQPAGLSATATHDTKRGEDARMRIAAIAEDPERWAAGVRTLDALAGTDGPDEDVRWLAYQALLGAWQPEDPDLPDRMADYVLKAAREAKLQTSWVNTDEDYETRLTGFVREMLGDAGFRETFDRLAAPFVAMGARKSLVQLALKLTAPGIPDIYQGTERADLSLVDPDNRRPVDFAMRARALDDAPGQGFDSAKTALMRFGLALRRDHPALFAEGGYEAAAVHLPSPLRGASFLRRHGAQVLAVAVELSGREGEGEIRVDLPGDTPLAPVATWPGQGVRTADGNLVARVTAPGWPLAIALLEPAGR